ncbi:hypothetical protein [Rhodoferax sp.]|uniref:hypothetical protein n=1 Tax=Rhodoferax sp. TaxID=50421 RepID=UPI0027523398|nr:hypothetical protein [Rhodoferax sp.]
MARQRLANYLLGINPQKYVRGMVIGGVLTQMADSYLKGRGYGPQAEHTPIEPPPQTPPDDLFAQANQQLEKRSTKVRNSSPVTQFVKGMNPMQWELPYHVHRSHELAKYWHHTSGEERGEDVYSGSKEKVQQVIKEAPYKPVETYHKVRKAGSVARGVYQEGPAKVEERLQEHLGLESGSAARQLGMNMMLKAPLFLLPGVPGLLARTYMNMKTVGNLGHSINEIHRASGKEDGLIMETVHRRLKTIEDTKKNANKS